MDVLLDILFDLIFEGVVYASTEKRVPLPLRILAGGFLVLFYGGLIAVFVYIAIKERSWIIGAVAGVILMITIGAAVKTYGRHR